MDFMGHFLKIGVKSSKFWIKKNGRHLVELLSSFFNQNLNSFSILSSRFSSFTLSMNSTHPIHYTASHATAAESLRKTEIENPLPSKSAVLTGQQH
jgi:hypothetical protein